jgi:hypothetical protein
MAEMAPPAAAVHVVNKAVKVVAKPPAIQSVRKNVTQVPMQESVRQMGPQGDAPKVTGPGQKQGRHLLVTRNVYKIITLKDGRKIRQLVSSGEPKEVTGPPPQQGGIVKVVQNNNAGQRRFPGPPGPPQRMQGPRLMPHRPGFRPFQGPRSYKQFQGQGPPGPGMRFRGPGPMGPRFRGPGPHMMRFPGPHRPPMGMPHGPRRMMRGPPPRQAVPPPAQGAPRGQKTGQGQRVVQNKNQVTGVKRMVNTAPSANTPGQGVTMPKRVS